MFKFFKRRRGPDRVGYAELPDELQAELEAVMLPGISTDQVRTVLGRVLASYPGFVTGRLNMAATYQNDGDSEQAKALYEAILADYPDEPGALGGMALAYAQLADWEQAGDYAVRAMAAGSEFRPLYRIRAQVAEHGGDVDGARAGYLDAYYREPHAWENLQDYCRLSGRPFYPPDDYQPPEVPLTAELVESLATYIDNVAHLPDADGELPLCDHSFRFTRLWIAEHGLDELEVLMYLNANGGFCDCEVCYTVTDCVMDPDWDEDDWDDEAPMDDRSL